MFSPSRFGQFRTLLLAVGLFMLIVIPLSGHAQFEEELTIDEVMRTYDETTMIMLNNGFEIGGKKKNYGVFNQHWRRQIKQSPAAEELRKKYARKSIGGSLLALTIVPGMALSAATVNPAPIIVGTIAYIAGFVLIIDVQDTRQRCIWVYNRDMLKKGLWQQCRSSRRLTTEHTGNVFVIFCFLNK